ncbi:MAG: glutamate--cysteine ligase [Mariprofundus sp.]|nr:glutamate--cysteine ligase [Mariprofundus sp.]
MSNNLSARLTFDDLPSWFAAGCKPRDAWRIGTEHEKIGFCMDSLKPIPYDGKRSIKGLLEMLAGHGWDPVVEGKNIIALKRGLASITLEPGGQLELSGAPLETIHQTCNETTEYHKLVRSISDELGIGFLTLAFQPKWQRDDIHWMPKARYAVMRDYMPRVGEAGLDMMLRTTTVQANLDFASEADMAKKMRISLCLQPLITAMYAASPFEGGKPSGYLSRRAACWLDTDPHRTGILQCAFEDDFGFEAYSQWALDAPMYFIMRDDAYIDCTGSSFRDFMLGKLPQLPGQYPDMNDWELHLSTLFPDVRLKQYLEMRGADAGAWPWICSLPALWKGLLYDPQAEDAAWNLIADWSFDEVNGLRQAVPRTALQTPFRQTTVVKLCEQVLNISKAGLQRLNQQNQAGEDESIFLEPVIRAVESSQTQAEHWLKLYQNEWNEDIDRVFFAAMH